MTPDRHLGAARVLPDLKPNMLITETTYASTIRDSKRAREREFLRKITETIEGGGKVSILVCIFNCHVLGSNSSFRSWSCSRIVHFA
jgi:Cft2 family RNA processing exonuclease